MRGSHLVITLELAARDISGYDHIGKRKQHRVLPPSLGPRARIPKPYHIEVRTKHVEPRFDKLAKEPHLHHKGHVTRV